MKRKASGGDFLSFPAGTLVVILMMGAPIAAAAV